jgi:glycerol-3-phosphate acyltransferase PlsY
MVLGDVIPIFVVFDGTAAIATRLLMPFCGSLFSAFFVDFGRIIPVAMNSE